MDSKYEESETPKTDGSEIKIVDSGDRVDSGDKSPSWKEDLSGDTDLLMAKMASNIEQFRVDLTEKLRIWGIIVKLLSLSVENPDVLDKESIKKVSELAVCKGLPPDGISVEDVDKMTALLEKERVLLRNMEDAFGSMMDSNGWQPVDLTAAQQSARLDQLTQDVLHYSVGRKWTELQSTLDDEKKTCFTTGAATIPIGDEEPDLISRNQRYINHVLSLGSKEKGTKEKGHEAKDDEDEDPEDEEERCLREMQAKLDAFRKRPPASLAMEITGVPVNVHLDQCLLRKPVFRIAGFVPRGFTTAKVEQCILPSHKPIDSPSVLHVVFDDVVEISRYGLQAGDKDFPRYWKLRYRDPVTNEYVTCAEHVNDQSIKSKRQAHVWDLGTPICSKDWRLVHRGPVQLCRLMLFTD